MNFLNTDYQQAFNTLGESGVGWIDGVFNICVMLLVDLAKILGISYEEINIWIFVIIWPLLSILAAVWIVFLKSRIRILKKQLG